jgi:hypothetical protein
LGWFFLYANVNDGTQETSAVQEEIATLIQRGQTGDRSVLPAIRALLDTHPVLWQEAQSLAATVERRWLQVLAGADLVTQEMVSRQHALQKADLLAHTTTPLERILVESFCNHLLQLQDAQLRAAGHQQRYGYVTAQQEKRLAQAAKLLESAAKTLAQVQRLLRPKAPVITVAHQQIVNLA